MADSDTAQQVTSQTETTQQAISQPDTTQQAISQTDTTHQVTSQKAATKPQKNPNRVRAGKATAAKTKNGT